MSTIVGICTGLLLLPLSSLVYALVRGLFAFWPVMIILGALHTHIPAVPPLGASATFFLVSLLSLLIPSNTTYVNKNN